jgi:hypothetical protein
MKMPLIVIFEKSAKYGFFLQKFILQTPAASTPRGRPRKNVDKGTPATTVSKASEDSSITEVTEENDENRKVVRFFIWKCDEIMIIL